MMDKDRRKMANGGGERQVINSNRLIVASCLVGTHFSPLLSHYSLQTSVSPMTTVKPKNQQSAHPGGYQLMSRQFWSPAGMWGDDTNIGKWAAQAWDFTSPHFHLPGPWGLNNYILEQRAWSTGRSSRRAFWLRCGELNAYCNIRGLSAWCISSYLHFLTKLSRSSISSHPLPRYSVQAQIDENLKDICMNS